MKSYRSRLDRLEGTLLGKREPGTCPLCAVMQLCADDGKTAADHCDGKHCDMTLDEVWRLTDSLN